MKKLFNFFLLLVLFTLGAYYFRSSLEQVPVFKEALTTVGLIDAPCTKPIPYTLGTFDTKFNISQDYFLSALADAEKVWEVPLKKDLFVYEPVATSADTLKVNLVYDYRQEATTKLNSLGITVDNNRASYDMLKAKFLALKTDYEKQKATFTTTLNTFNQKQLQYNQDVSYWNKKGGAPEAEYNKLQAEKIELQNQSHDLNATQANLNSMVGEINALVTAVNRLANSLNLSVETYNSTNTARGESFEEGMYSENGTNKEIDIYEFSNRAKLVRVLAHELGHALGLDHVADPKAIMYKFNQGNSETLSQADINELNLVCSGK